MIKATYAKMKITNDQIKNLILEIKGYLEVLQSRSKLLDEIKQELIEIKNRDNDADNPSIPSTRFIALTITTYTKREKIIDSNSDNS